MRRRPVDERFYEKCELDQNGCWVWTAYTDAWGYGRLRVDGRSVEAHRVGYELVVGPIPEGLELDHLCRKPACVNPFHLEPVTTAVNVERSSSPPALNKRKTHCKHGHAFDEANTYRTGGARKCRTCNRAAVARRVARRRTKA
jgi:hypothetical protein